MSLEHKNLRDYLIQEYGDEEIWQVYIHIPYEPYLDGLYTYKQAFKLANSGVGEGQNYIMFDFSELERLCQKED